MMIENTSIPAAMSVADFCQSFRISRSFIYKLWKAGEGPRVLKVGNRTLISVEAASEWRRRMEAQTAEGVA